MTAVLSVPFLTLFSDMATSPSSDLRPTAGRLGGGRSSPFMVTVSLALPCRYKHMFSPQCKRYAGGWLNDVELSGHAVAAQ